MNYPLISEYIEAIKAAEENFEELKHLRPVLDENGEPMFSSGNFAVVFKMKDERTGKLHAVKCFLKEQEGRAEAYRLIAEELEYVSSTFLTPIKYLDNELFVDTAQTIETEFPVLLMDWVEGQTLDKYIREHIDDQYELSLLAYQFSRLAMWLMPQPFAHGDLKPDNILVRKDGTLALVDYDGMYVPGMKGQKARELGSPDFRHPSRTEDVFDEHIDDFSLVSILLSLKAIALQPELLEQYGASDRLLFSEKDYRNLSGSQVMDTIKTMMQDPELATLYSLFILSSAQNDLSQASFRLLNLNKPQVTKKDNLSTVVTEEDLAKALSDEFGVKYSLDGKRLLRVPYDLHGYYTIKSETKVICDSAFNSCFLTKVSIPQSIKSIGDKAFSGCGFLASIEIPKNVESIGNWAFSYTNLNSIIIPQNVKYIGDGVFCNCPNLSKILVDKNNSSYDSRYDCNAIIETKTNTLIIGCQNTIIPETVVKIKKWAFSGCANLINIAIPLGVICVENRAFSDCDDLKMISVDINNKVYDSRNNCNGIIETSSNTLIAGCKNTVIPNDVTCIGSWAFSGCDSLTRIDIPESVVSIKEGAFSGCINLATVSLPENMISIGPCAFSNSGITSFIIPNGVKILSNHLFNCCRCLISASIPNNVTNIGESAFSQCRSLSSIIIPESVTSIGSWAFACCDSLSSIKIPNGITSIGKGAFYNCLSLTQIVIPKGKRTQFEIMLQEYKDKLVEIDDSEVLRTDVRGDDLANAWTDEYGVKYSADRKRLLKAPGDINNYAIREGTQIVCDLAFNEIIKRAHSKTFNHSLIGLKTISIPDSVTVVGNSIFAACSNLGTIYIPIGTRSKFEKLLPEHKDKLVEQEMGWTVKDTRSFNAEEIALVKRAEVVPSQYGNSVCFFMQTGGQTYIPLSKHSKLTVGDELDIRTAKLMTLSRKGSADITRGIE